MALVQDPQNPLEWRNPEWTGGPGTFAVVLGVSAYAHVEGGTGPKASQTYGLGQLPGSVLTAMTFFKWLEEEYRSTSAPLARCYLALSPTDVERRSEPRLASVPEASFRNCGDAVGLWRNAMRALHPEYSAKSRALFFFSGHGIEVHHDKQILLPADYLRPPTENVNEALSTENLAKGLRALSVTEQFFFMDACRADHEELRATHIRGAEVLPEGPAAYSPRDLVQPLFYACTPGRVAYTPDSGELSVFGQALLDGLRAHAGMQLSCRPTHCEIRVFNLASFLNERVPQLLSQYGGNERMGTRLGGVVMDACVTEVSARATPEYRNLLLHYSSPGANLQEADLGAGPPSRRVKVDASKPLPAEVADALSRLRLADFDAQGLGAERPLEASWSSVLRRGRQYRIGFKSQGRAAWIQSQGAAQVCACVVPDSRESAKFVLDISVSKGTRDIESLSLALDTDNASPLHEAAVIWHRLRTGRLADAVEPKLLTSLEHVLRDKLESPLAATVAGTVLLRLGAFKYLHDWLRNLSEYFPFVPDGPVLWMEHLLRDPGALKHLPPGRSLDDELALQLSRVAERGLPHSAEGLSHLASLLGRFRQVPVAGVSPELLAGLTAQVDRMLPLFRPEGFSLSFRGPADAVSPELILPARAPVPS
ncbi:caspase family protein [Pyxidicoccus sp. 3LG]